MEIIVQLFLDFITNFDGNKIRLSFIRLVGRLIDLRRNPLMQSFVVSLVNYADGSHAGRNRPIKGGLYASLYATKVDDTAFKNSLEFLKGFLWYHSLLGDVFQEARLVDVAGYALRINSRRKLTLSEKQAFELVADYYGRVGQIVHDGDPTIPIEHAFTYYINIIENQPLESARLEKYRLELKYLRNLKQSDQLRAAASTLAQG